MNMLFLLFSQALYFPPQPDIFLERVGEPGTKPWAFFAPHQNERVINQYVATKVIQEGGLFAVLRQQGGRHIHLKHGGLSYEIDPNRIFTKQGRETSLKRLNPDLDQTSDEFKKLSQLSGQLAVFIMTHLQSDTATDWIAIHNNTNGYDNDGKGGRGTISIDRYEAKLAAGANYLIKVNNSGDDEDNLFFITDPNDFKIMSDANWNVVLQNPDVAQDPDEDDGSLSVLAEIKNKRYINVEAERSDDGYGMDRYESQKKMVDLTFQLLKTQSN